MHYSDEKEDKLLLSCSLTWISLSQGTQQRNGSKSTITTTLLAGICSAGLASKQIAGLMYSSTCWPVSRLHSHWCRFGSIFLVGKARWWPGIGMCWGGALHGGAASHLHKCSGWGWSAARHTSGCTHTPVNVRMRVLHMCIRTSLWTILTWECKAPQFYRSGFSTCWTLQQHLIRYAVLRSDLAGTSCMLIHVSAVV